MTRVTAVENTGRARRSTTAVPDLYDNYVEAGCQLSYSNGRLLLGTGTLTLEDGVTVYGVSVDDQTFQLASGTATVYCVVDASLPKAAIELRSSVPQEPHLAVGQVDADAGTTSELNREPDFASGALAAEKANIAEHTEVFESDAGSTVLRNTDGKPINIQLYPSGRAFLVANQSAETVINTQNEWYEVAGTWEAAHLNYLTHDGSGGLTYDGDVTTQVQYQVGGSYISPSNNAEYEIAMFKNGAVKDRTVISFSPPRQDERLSLPGLFGFTDTTTTGMRHSVRVRCTNGTTNITIPALSFTLRG